jgi:hypothetical protein
MWGTRKIVPLLVFLPSTIPFLNPLTIGASLEASIPSGEITLAHGSTFTVPAGITVLRASFNQSGYLNLITYVGVTPNKSYKLYSNWTEYNYGEGEEYLLYNANNDKYWIDYTIGNLDVDTGYTKLNFKLEWSPTINSHAVEVTDY